jgi:ATP-dependent Clp protease ATP-binding subunit ClpC
MTTNVTGVFEPFTDGSRRVVVLAQEQARQLRHDVIGPEHLLLGMLLEEDGIARTALERLNVDASEVFPLVEQGRTSKQRHVRGHIPLTHAAKKTLEFALREAKQLGDKFIGTEHLALGMSGNESCTAMQILNELGVTSSRLRDTVTEMLA